MYGRGSPINNKDWRKQITLAILSLYLVSAATSHAQKLTSPLTLLLYSNPLPAPAHHIRCSTNPDHFYVHASSNIFKNPFSMCVYSTALVQLCLKREDEKAGSRMRVQFMVLTTKHSRFTHAGIKCKCTLAHLQSNIMKDDLDACLNELHELSSVVCCFVWHLICFPFAVKESVNILTNFPQNILGLLKKSYCLFVMRTLHIYMLPMLR